MRKNFNEINFELEELTPTGYKEDHSQKFKAKYVIELKRYINNFIFQNPLNVLLHEAKETSMHLTAPFTITAAARVQFLLFNEWQSVSFFACLSNNLHEFPALMELITWVSKLVFFIHARIFSEFQFARRQSYLICSL